MSKEEEWDQVGVLVWLIIVFGIDDLTDLIADGSFKPC